MFLPYFKLFEIDSLQLLFAFVVIAIAMVTYNKWLLGGFQPMRLFRLPVTITFTVHVSCYGCVVSLSHVVDVLAFFLLADVKYLLTGLTNVSIVTEAVCCALLLPVF